MALAVGPLIKAVKKYGPKLGPAVAAVIAFIIDHPDLPKKVLDTLRRVLGQVALVYLKHGDAAKAQGNLRIVRENAPKLSGDDPESASTVAAWLKRADGIEVGLQVAAGLSQPEKKNALANLRARSETLLAEVLKASIGA